MHEFYGALYSSMAEGVRDIGDIFYSYLYVSSDAFFVISGYFIAYGFKPGNWSYLSVSRFFARRFLRLALPFWAAVLLGLIGLYFRRDVLNVHVPGEHYLPTLTTVWPTLLFVSDLVGNAQSTNFAFWFMAPLMQFFIIWAGSFWLMRGVALRLKIEHFHIWALNAMVVMTAVIYCGSLFFVLSGAPSHWMLPQKAIFLCLGCLACWKSMRLRVGPMLWLGVLACVSSAIYLDSPRTLWAALISLAIPTAIHWDGMPNYRLTRLLASIGVFSYSIYLTHMYTAPRVLFLGRAWMPDMSPAAAFGFYLLAIIFAVTAAYLFHRVVEKPITRWTRQIDYRAVAVKP